MHDVTPEQAARHEVNFLVWFSLSATHTDKEWIREGGGAVAAATRLMGGVIGW